MKVSIRAIGTWTVAAWCLCSWGAVSGEAAAAFDPAVLSSLRPGQRVRLTTSDGKTVGRFVALREGRLILEAPDAAIPIDSIRDGHVRARGTGNGAVIGGATLGLATGVLFAFAVAAYCEYDCDGSASLVAGAMGALGGGLAGGTTGALIGAPIPHWRRLDRPRGAPTGRHLGSAWLDLGYGRPVNTFSPHGGPGGRLALRAELGAITSGLEIGRYGLGGGRAVGHRGQVLDYSESLFFFGPTITVGPPREGLRPYVQASVGHYTWTTFDPQVLSRLSGVEDNTADRQFAGGSLGAGVRWQAASQLSLGIEGRWHTNITHVPRVAAGEGERRLSVMSLNAGAALSW